MAKQHGKPEQDKNPHDPWDDDILSAVKSFERFEYDAVGNWVRMQDDFGTTNYTYNAANQLLRAGGTRYEYEVNGNSISKQDSRGRTAYAYTVDNLLARVDAPNGDSSVYHYDAFGHLAEGPGAIHAGPENSWGLDVPGGSRMAGACTSTMAWRWSRSLPAHTWSTSRPTTALARASSPARAIRRS